MFPYYAYDDSQMMSPMELPFYQQLQLSPPSPKPDQPFYYTYPYSPPFADDGGFHLAAASSSVMMEYTPPPPPLSPPPPSPPKVECDERARKDRHSKICTAGGMRDRRMRLSLDVARRFFALQDKLGFDKASKTVQWLLDKSKAAIKELVSTTSVSSECENGSSLSDSKHNEPPELGKQRAPKGKRAAPKAPKKGNAHTVIPDKESRARARERARERTRERNRLRWATLASSIAVEEAPSSRHLNVEERMQQEVSMASDQSSDVIPSFEHNSSSSSSYYQEQWELSGVVFANARLH